MGLLFCLCLPQMQGCTRLVAGEGAATLVDLKKDEAKKQEMLNRQESDFQAMKEAIQKQRLAVGMRGAAARRVSSPVLIVAEGNGSRWVYTGKKTGMLNGPKIYLFFDGYDHLTSWECIRIDGGCQ